MNPQGFGASFVPPGAMRASFTCGSWRCCRDMRRRAPPSATPLILAPKSWKMPKIDVTPDRGAPVANVGAGVAILSRERRKRQ